MDLKLKTWGQMGVTRIAGTAGCTTDPPAAMLYAVDPVGLCNRMNKRVIVSSYARQLAVHTVHASTNNSRCKDDPICLNCGEMYRIAKAFKCSKIGATSTIN